MSENTSAHVSRDLAGAAARRRTITTVLALTILLLLGQAEWQAMRISALKAEVTQRQLALEQAVDRLAIEKLERPRDELVDVVNWLDDVYRSADGLQRPTGLWRADTNKPDGEALGVWILDVYLQARISGASEAAARQAVLDQIRATDEWRRKHGER